MNYKSAMADGEFAWAKQPLAGLVCRSRKDFFDDSSFGVRVFLHVFPCPGREVELGALVQKPVFFIGTKPVSECEHALNFRASDGKAVEIDIRFGTFKHAMLVPLRFADSQYIARSLECGNVGRFVCGVREHEQNIYAGFGSKSGHRRRAHMLDRNHAAIECGDYPRSLFLE